MINIKTRVEIEEFLCNLAEIVKAGRLHESKKLYEAFPLVRICLRRALMIVKKRGMIPKDFPCGGNETQRHLTY